MKTGRDDLNLIFRNTSIPADEPVFFLRAQNITAAATVRDWAAREKAQKSPLAVIEQALRQSDAMDLWPTKRPLNADHLTDAQSKQLIYAHGRRQWNAGKIIAEAHAAAMMAQIVNTLVEWGASGAMDHGPHGPRPLPICVLNLIEVAQELRRTVK